MGGGAFHRKRGGRNNTKKEKAKKVMSRKEPESREKRFDWKRIPLLSKRKKPDKGNWGGWRQNIPQTNNAGNARSQIELVPILLIERKGKC